MSTPVARIRCAENSRSCGMPVAGTAMRAPGGVLLVEWPLPWPRDIAEIDELASVIAHARERDVRLLLVCSDQQPGAIRTVCFYRGPGAGAESFTSFTRVERRCAAEAVVATAMALLEGGDGEQHLASAPPDLVVCTHGRRDRCCGATGTDLYRQLIASRPALKARVWRSSHHGGHHMAPTALFLPEGTSWSHLDPDVVRGIVGRTAAPEQIIDRLRGCAGLHDPQAQVLDGLAFAQHGWSWFDRSRHVQRRDACVEVITRADDGQAIACTGIVEKQVRTMPACGASPNEDGDVPLVEHRVHEIVAYRLDSTPAQGESAVAYSGDI